MAKIHAIRTGSVLCKKAQLSAEGSYPGRIAKVLSSNEWTGWLPIYAWLIESSKGLVLADTGETARVHDQGYHPGWHPFYQRATRFQIAPEDELGSQLRLMGVDAREIQHVVLTHLHTDHAGGLRHVVGTKMWVHAQELKAASGLLGKLNGYLPHRWPRWWSPNTIEFKKQNVGPFDACMDLNGDEEILLLPTPGHTLGHVSVLVQGSPSILIAGDASYSQRQLIDGNVDGITPNTKLYRETAEKIRTLGRERALVYLPSHDPEGLERMQKGVTL